MNGMDASGNPSKTPTNVYGGGRKENATSCLVMMSQTSTISSRRRNMYYSSGNYEAFARPKKPAGVDGKSAYIIGTGLAALSGGLLSGARCADAGQEHPHPRKARWPAGVRARHSRPRLCHARRARDGQPLRGDVGPVPLYPVDRDRRRLRARRVLLAQQGRPQLFAVPRHQGPRARCGTPGQIRAERQARWRS